MDVTADEIRFVIDEQWIHSGWLRATRLIDVAVTASTGDGALIRYGLEPNSITADVGSVIQTTGDESLVKLASTTGSIIVATAVAVGGADSAMEINAGSGLRLLEGASLAVEVIDVPGHTAVGRPAGLVMGYALLAAAQIEEGVHRLAEAYRRLRQPGGPAGRPPASSAPYAGGRSPQGMNP